VRFGHLPLCEEPHTPNFDDRKIPGLEPDREQVVFIEGAIEDV
jgi:hypothetical protein